METQGRKYTLTIDRRDGQIRFIVEKLDEGKEITLEYLRDRVHGYIEHINLDNYLPGIFEYEVDTWINEEGKLDNLEPILPLYNLITGRLIDVLVGPLVFTRSNNLGETYGLTKAELIHIILETNAYYFRTFGITPVPWFEFDDMALFAELQKELFEQIKP